MLIAGCSWPVCLRKMSAPCGLSGYGGKHLCEPTSVLSCAVPRTVCWFYYFTLWITYLFFYPIVFPVVVILSDYTHTNEPCLKFLSTANTSSCIENAQDLWNYKNLFVPRALHFLTLDTKVKTNFRFFISFRIIEDFPHQNINVLCSINVLRLNVVSSVIGGLFCILVFMNPIFYIVDKLSLFCFDLFCIFNPELPQTKVSHGSCRRYS